MQYFLLMIVIIMCAAQNVITKQYNIKAKSNNKFFFSSVSAFAAFMFFLVSSGFRITLSSDYMLYSVGFGVAYAACGIATFLAIKWGSLSITGLITSYSLVIPALYGMIALHEKMSGAGVVGMVCLLLSLFLINDRTEKSIFSWKWLAALSIAFLGNGMCSTIQKMQQIACEGAYKSDFMIVALLLVTLVFGAAAFWQKEKITDGIGLCTILGTAKGVANGIVNLLVMVLAGMIPNTVLFPSVSAGGIVLGFLAAVIIYKEKLSRQQLIGYAIGTISVILLNI